MAKYRFFCIIIHTGFYLSFVYTTNIFNTRKAYVENPWIIFVFKIKSDKVMRWNPRWAYHDYRPRKTKHYLRFYFIHIERFLFVIEVWHKCIESELSFERYFRCIHLFYFEPLKAKVISFSRTSFFPTRKCSLLGMS